MAVNEPGPAVDVHGRSAMDPTENVREILDSAVKRQDDLRGQESRHVREIAELRSADQEVLARVRADYEKELRSAESARIDAIRAVDVGAVQRAAEGASAAAATLAATVATSADAMRAQVTAAAVAAQAALVPILDAIAELRQSQWQGVGEKTQVVESRQEGVAKGANMGLWIAAAATVSAFFFGVAAVVIAIVLK